MNTFELNNGVKIPQVGLGTYQMKSEIAEKTVLTALKNDYRLIDTANDYFNEKAVGRAIKESGISREEIFVSSKLWPTVYEDKNAIDDTLRRLGLNYIDLLFLHQPSGNWQAGYKQLEQAYLAGKVRVLGISNFHDQKLHQLFDEAQIKSQVIQVEAHPYYPQKELKKFLKPYGTRLMAWFPLGHGYSNLLNEPIFSKLGKKYHKSNAQIILRWHLQMGNITIPGSTNVDHLKDNINIFDFTLNDDEMAKIGKLDKNKPYYVPTASLEEHYAHVKMNFDQQK